jgi:hypothetical protein
MTGFAYRKVLAKLMLVEFSGKISLTGPQVSGHRIIRGDKVVMSWQRLFAHIMSMLIQARRSAYPQAAMD